MPKLLASMQPSPVSLGDVRAQVTEVFPQIPFNKKYFFRLGTPTEHNLQKENKLTVAKPIKEVITNDVVLQSVSDRSDWLLLNFEFLRAQ